MSSIKRRKIESNVASGLKKQKEPKSPVPSEQSEVVSESSVVAPDEPNVVREELAVKSFKDLV